MIKLEVNENTENKAKEHWDELKDVVNKRIEFLKEYVEGSRQKDSTLKKLIDKVGPSSEIIKCLKKFFNNDFFEDGNCKDLVKFFRPEDIITAKPEELRDLAEKWKALLNSIEVAEQELLLEMGKYVYLTIYKDVAKFDKHKHFSRVGLTVCPYCNRNFIFNLDNDEKGDGVIKVKGQIDHFFPQDKYPILALSYYNLIPSCQTCNFVKSNVDPLDIDEFRSPYEINESETKFEISIADVSLITSIYRLDPKNKEKLMSELKVKFYYNPKRDNDKKKEDLKDTNNKEENNQEHRVTNNSREKKQKNPYNKVFHIEKIYNKHVDVGLDIIRQAVMLDKTYIDKVIRQFFPDLPMESIYRMIFGYDKDDLGQLPLSKFKKDLLKNLGIEL